MVALTSYVEPASWRSWHDVPAALLPHAYVGHVQRAGGVALLLPPAPGGRDDLEAALERVDAVIITGGADVAAHRYRAAVHPQAQEPRPDRDDTELLVAEVAAERDLPLLGICRGMQVMAVAAGGTLEQHLPDVLGHGRHSPAPATYGTHRVDTAPGSVLRDVLGASVEVATYHHQGVRTHPGHRASGWADDGLLEAIEATGARFRVGVQWHPEVRDDPRLFQALVAAAR